MSHEWSLFVQEQVQKENRIPLPEGVQDTVGYDHEVHGPSVYWNYEKNAHYVVLSRYELRANNYQPVDRYKILNPNTDQKRLYIPQHEPIKSRFFEKTRVNFMAYDRMIDNDNPTIFMLTNPQFQKLLPADVQDVVSQTGEKDELRQSVLELPGFLPSP